MSPYTSQVVDEIGRLGNRNLTENIVPGVMSNFVGSGQFGSSRNAEILGRSVRDAQTDITGQQAMSLERGYQVGSNIFGADANRNQQQQLNQSNANISAGNLGVAGANAAGTFANNMGGLAQMRQQLGNVDATTLGAIGGQQQALEQSGYDASKAEFDKQQDWDWTQLGKVQGAVQGAQLPTGVTQSTNAPIPGAGSGTSPLGWLTAIGGLYEAFKP
jgi:hypothetical protein